MKNLLTVLSGTAATLTAATLAAATLAAPASAVVGGEEAGDQPWTRSIVQIQSAAIDRSGDEPVVGPWQQTCAGTIIGRSTILTADHCMHDDSEMRVVFGARASSPELGEGVQVRQIEKVRLPSAGWKVNDIAVLTLDEPLRGAVIAELPEIGDSSRIRVGEEVVLAGWGQDVPGWPDDDTAPTVRPLRTLTVPVVSPPLPDAELCNGTDGRFCAGAPGVGTCFGDSGGPVFASPGERRPVVVGIVTSSTGECGAADNVGVYTSTADEANRSAVGLR